mmetsp:Transcript_31091/g.70689  ORF Transcript_31091/g.70689 Transcript_31091/m.70689 type:complete len:369 (+) Transcript_31091:69-1175(+)|eukprot:CAMPEP_0197902564 /NCGR_PEP_ID=MMETSP1439-20131203/53752_1 /TAXON_ID=66791 /ORGANISM="Gonyaulax spinifera, Strain CCMP409" /LENGTH=368 /DNA_ID=CAMNT_0043523601 /DNA_START=70 /DNA_END=1176 /DNA_ORIENTATION=-
MTNCQLLGAFAAALLCSAFLQGCGQQDSHPPSPSPAPPPAPTVRLRSGANMPVISAGTWQYDDATAEASVEAALAAGFSHIDTANDYGNQQGVGRAIKKSGKPRKSLFITTKVPGCGLQNVSGSSVEECRNDTSARLAEDLKQLDLTYVDLMLIHFPPCPGGDGSAKSPAQVTCFAQKTGCSDPKSCDLVRAQWSVLTEAYNKKQALSIGVSNYCSACFQCLEAEKGVIMPMVNQVQYHVGMHPDPQGFKTFAEQHDMVLQAWSPLGSGGHGSAELLKGNLTTSIGRKHGKSSVQIALKWIVSRNVSVATKSSNPEHLREDLDIFDFDLDHEDLQALDTADFAAKDTPSFLCSDPQPHLVPQVDQVVI